ncbi:MAG TPA: hypothetical protein VN851_19965 [Thermoanaerobaculia bacterium]|nr:hypothetical protein [Thermoanaerobaculia bacterium]
MDDSGFLRDLARTALEEEAEEPQRWERWDRLADGNLSPEEEAELQTLAATSSEDKMAFEAFRPLDEDFRARMAGMFGQLVPGSASPAEAEAPEVPVPEERPRPVREEKNRRGFTFPGWRLGFAGPGLAAAAVAFYFVIFLPRLPVITVTEVKSGIETRRGDQKPQATTALVAGAQFTAEMHPAAKLSSLAPLAPRCYLKLRKPNDRKLITVKCAASDRFPNGAMKIQGSLLGDLPAGPATLWIVLAYPGHQPEEVEIEKLLTDRPARKRYWDAEPTEIEVRRL